MQLAADQGGQNPRANVAIAHEGHMGRKGEAEIHPRDPRAAHRVIGRDALCHQRAGTRQRRLPGRSIAALQAGDTAGRFSEGGTDLRQKPLPLDQFTGCEGRQDGREHAGHQGSRAAGGVGRQPRSNAEHDERAEQHGAG